MYLLLKYLSYIVFKQKLFIKILKNFIAKLSRSNLNSWLEVILKIYFTVIFRLFNNNNNIKTKGTIFSINRLKKAIFFPRFENFPRVPSVFKCLMIVITSTTKFKVILLKIDSTFIISVDSYKLIFVILLLL